MQNPNTVYVQKIFTEQRPYVNPRGKDWPMIQHSSRLRIIILQTDDDVHSNQYRIVNFEGQVTPVSTLGVRKSNRDLTLVHVMDMRKKGPITPFVYSSERFFKILFSHDETLYMEIVGSENKQYVIRIIEIAGGIIHDKFTINEKPIGLTDKVLLTLRKTTEPFYYNGQLQQEMYYNKRLISVTKKLKEVPVNYIQLRLLTNLQKVIKEIKSPLPKAKMERGRLFIGPNNLFTAIPGPSNTFLFVYNHNEPVIGSKDEDHIRGNFSTYIAKYRFIPYINMADFLMEKLEYQDEQEFLDDLNS